MARLIDLLHLGRPNAIGAYLLDGDEPAIVDCGPTSCVDALKRGLADAGLVLADVRHLLLTHIHLDHAGAAGVLVREHPGLRVHVSELGAPHLVDPERLERSARRLYGGDFDRLFGELAPVPQESIDVVGDRVLALEAFPTPGHASHHVTFLDADGSCYAGDVAGVRILPASFVLPVTPPPDVDLEAWGRALDAIHERRPARLCLPHFGVAEDPLDHLAAMRERLNAWAERVRAGASVEEFEAAGEAELAEAVPPETVDAYRQTVPFWQSHAGLARYWEKKATPVT